MILVVTGGREYHNHAVVYAMLDAIHAATPITMLIEGGATGADRLAEMWAVSRGVKWRREQADWARHGNGAGEIRNQLMLDKYQPDVGVIFPGGPGTADMTRRMKAISYADAITELSPGVYRIELGLGKAKI